MEKGVVQIGKRNSKLHHQPLQRLYYSFFHYFLRVIKDLTDVEFPLRPTLTQRKRVRERERILENQGFSSMNSQFFRDAFLQNSSTPCSKFSPSLWFAIQCRITLTHRLSSLRRRSPTPARSTSRPAPANKFNAEFASKLMVIVLRILDSMFLSVLYNWC